jgi:hypothetical protein
MKKKLRIILLFILSLTYISCQQEKEINYIKRLKSVIDLDYPMDFKVTWTESSSGSGDYDDSFELTFSENSFRKIINQMDTLKLGKVVNLPSAFFIHKQIKENEFKEVTFNLLKKTVVYTHGEL